MVDSEQVVATTTSTGVPPTPAADETLPNPAESSAAEAVTTDVKSAAPFNWDDPANPHFYAAQQAWQAVQSLQAQLQQATAQQTTDQLRKQGYSDEQIGAALSMQQREAALAQREAAVQEQSRVPAATMLAERISAQTGVKIEASELLTTSMGTPVTSPEAMIARADALIMERRKEAMAKRQASGADKVGKTGGTSPTIDPARFKGMKPAQIIAEGMKQLQNRQ